MMGRISDEDILLAARNLQLRWQDLLGKSGASRAEALLAALDPEDDEEVRRTANWLLELFRQNEALAELREALSAETAFTNGDFGERLFQPLPGEQAPIASPEITYCCPIPGCGYTWRPQAAGKPVPYCPHHPDLRLVET